MFHELKEKIPEIVLYAQKKKTYFSDMLWGNGIGRRKLRTSNLIAGYRWQFECTGKP